jgi:hypothetical protein
MGMKKNNPNGISKIERPNYGRNVNENLLNEESAGQGIWKLLARHDSAEGEGVRDQACCTTQTCYGGACGWSGFLMIPEECQGVYDRYLIKGATTCYENYCSSLNLYFGGQGAACNTNCEHGEHISCSTSFCGRYWNECSRSCFSCGNNIPWINGCSSGHETACTQCGWAWDTEIMARPSSFECDGMGFFLNHTRTSGCDRNTWKYHGYGEACCCTSAKCLRGVWYTNPSEVTTAYGASTVEIYGYNDNFKKERFADVEGDYHSGEESLNGSKIKKQLFDHSNDNTKHCIDPKYKK